MENPGTWGQAERIVSAAIEHNVVIERADQARGEFRAGLSLARQITDALREAGLLKEEPA